ncbi:hypothetical protein BDN72DRAFT_844196 [Pluteus cervinus]|uniref:Uncharacterized protein n=1 Tax=Pluteus cervinus TaxID=181527 RepID=A0ACD3ALR0_9AGAR|nr:hypothetical protein BDN72DRAFT_844196 [Pluteus cervinus]
MHSSPTSATPRGTPARRGKSPRFRGDSPPQPGSSSLASNLDSKPASTFTSSLDIRVEGVVQFDTDFPPKPATPSVSAEQESSTTESRRAPRKSKSDALAALSHHARASSLGPDDFDQPQDFTEKYRAAPPIPIPSRLDMSSVKTSSPEIHSIPRSSSRPFGLSDCPEYRPTPEEFKDPMAYIQSIADEAKNYGICKIIPPDDWKMPFTTNTENFRFRTRLQRLNSIEASARAKLNFLEQLYKFHKQQGNPRVVVPTINHKPLDLWLLRKEVHKMGGYEAVTKGKKWSDLGRILGYRGIPGLSTQIKNSYTRVILPYEHFCDRAKNSPAMSSILARDQLKNGAPLSPEPPSRLSTGLDTNTDSPPSSPLTATSSPLSEPPDEGDMKGAEGSKGSRTRRSTRMKSQEQTPRKPGFSSGSVVPPPIFYDKPDTKGTNEQSCEICHKANRGEEMLLCDGCDCGFHMFCLDPPLDSIPKEQWFCFTCLSGTGGDFGFDEGEEHSLSSFRARDLEFRRMWFESHPPIQQMDTGPDGVNDPTINHFGNVDVTEHDVEREFWRLVQSPTETVEIEYGADVHSTFHGSAMPTMETHPLDSYAKDPWNLNNIAILSDSLLRFIKSDISGMTVPWIYVGMVFSTFCWHNEDHYTYSINFMHWGETKTWYGIPGEDAQKFEAAIKCEAPDLFEAQPDLLFQLVTLMNPQRVSDADVRVYACNQRPGEFVITFPEAYHAGFNHGLNFNEAVNFALPNWLPYGRDCVQRYREHRKLPVFSHDELLITITQQSPTINTAMWLLDSLKEMTEREMNDRAKARALGFSEILEEEDRLEDQYQCTVCKVFCYLSQVICSCSTRVVCVEHHHLLCANPTLNHLTLRKRFSDEDLLEKQAKVTERASIPSTWRNKLNKHLSESATPPLRSLRALVAEGEQLNYYFPELASLKKCVSRASDWVDQANTFLMRKQSRKRARRSRGRPDGPVDDLADRPDRGLDELYKLIQEVDKLGFDCPQIASLQTLATRAESIKKQATALLSTPANEQEQESFLTECKKLLLDGSSLNVYLDELNAVESIVERDTLVKELEEKMDDSDITLTLDEVRQLLGRARACNLSSDNAHLQALETREHVGEEWEQRAQAILSKPVKTIEELNQVADDDISIPVDPAALQRLNSARAKANDFERQANSWLNPEPDALKPRVQDVLKLLARAEKDFDIPVVKELKQLADQAAAREAECEQIRRDRLDGPTSGRDVLRQIEEWKADAEKFSIFSMPAFEKLETEYAEHCKWMEGLPWYCKEHRRPHGAQILNDVIENTRPEDDLPPANEYVTCICPKPVCPPPHGGTSDAMQCDNCHARFHGLCAKQDGSCPFCDHHHWNGVITKERNWHFCYLPTILAQAPELTKRWSQEWKELEIIVHRVDRLSSVIGQFLSYTLQPINQDPKYIHQVRHYMRKLYKLQFAISSNPDVSYGLDLAGLHRMLANQSTTTKMKKRRRPRFTFGQDVDGDWSDGTRCVCRGRNPYYTHCQKVSCKGCHRAYHINCVYFPPDASPSDKDAYFCPLCCLRKGKQYQHAEVRVKSSDGSLEPDVYIDIDSMLDTFSKDVIHKKLRPPSSINTVFLELVKFTPGYLPENNGSTSKNGPLPLASTSHLPLQRPQVIPHPHAQPYLIAQSHVALHPHDPYMHTRLPYHHPAGAIPTAHYPPNPHAPPGTPAAWSRWGAVATPTQPPSTQRRQNGDSTRTTPVPLLPPPSLHSPHSNGLPPAPLLPITTSTNGSASANSSPVAAANKKRKHSDAPSPNGEELRRPPTANGNGTNTVPPSPKRRALPHSQSSPSPHPLTPAKPSPPNVQSLSPSLAFIVSPVNQS